MPMRPRTAAFAAVALLAMIPLAGCVNQAQPLRAPALGALPGALGGSFTPQLALPKGDGNGEPSLAIDAKSGTIYASAPGGSLLWISHDNGTTWNVTSPQMDVAGVPVPHQGGGDSDIAVDTAGRIWFADLWLVSTTVSTSTDGGQTWFDNPVASDTVANDRQWIATYKDGTAYLVYNQLATGPIVTKSTDGGNTWIPSPLFATAIDPNGYKTQLDFWSMGNLVVDPKDGTVYTTWATGNALKPTEVPGYPYTYAVMVSTSTDGGTTWTHTKATQQTVDIGNIFPVLALDKAGTAYVVWSQPSPAGKGYDVFLSFSKDKAKTWSTPVAVDPPGGTNVQPWVTAGEPGQVVVAWYGTNESADPNDVKGDWFVHIATTRNGDTAAPEFQQGLVSPQPNHEGPICLTGITCTGNRQLLDYFEVVLDARGLAHVVWTADYDQKQTQILYAHGTAPVFGAPTMPGMNTTM